MIWIDNPDYETGVVDIPEKDLPKEDCLFCFRNRAVFMVRWQPKIYEFRIDNMSQKFWLEWGGWSSVSHYCEVILPPADKCEHGIRDGMFCVSCNREYKRAAKENQS